MAVASAEAVWSLPTGFWRRLTALMALTDSASHWALTIVPLTSHRKSPSPPPPTPSTPDGIPPPWPMILPSSACHLPLPSPVSWCTFHFSSPHDIFHFQNIITAEIAPICLAPSTESNHVGDTLLVSGWGKTADGILEGVSPVLMKVTAPGITTAECAAVYGDIITDNILCIDTTGGRGSCNVSFQRFKFWIFCGDLIWFVWITGWLWWPIELRQCRCLQPGRYRQLRCSRRLRWWIPRWIHPCFQLQPMDRWHHWSDHLNLFSPLNCVFGVCISAFYCLFLFDADLVV